MSYYVEYNPELTEKYPISKNKKRIAFGRILISIVAVMLSIYCLTQNNVREFLIPGDPDITVKATEELVEDIKNGAPLIDALTVFCETVAGRVND